MLGGRPLRIVIVGSSVGYFVEPRESPERGCYGEELEKLLWRDGQPATVVNESGWLMRVDEIFADAERRLLRHMPNVVIVNVGWVEAQPLVLPLPLLRWTMSWRPDLGPLSLAVRRVVRPPLKKLHLTWGPRWIRAGRPVPSRLALARFERELERLIELLHDRQRPLMLFLTIPPTSSRVEAVLPGMDERAARYSDAIANVVNRAGDPDVRVVDVRSLVRSHDEGEILEDGIHLNAAGHALVAEALAREVAVWLDRHPSLRRA